MTYEEAYAKALRLLNVRFLSEKELRQKLMRSGAGDAVIDDVVQTLQEERFLDDLRLAYQVYAYYARKGQYGHAYIVNKLRRRALPIPEDVERPDELTVAEQLVAKKFACEEDKRKIARYLQNRGFAPYVIRDIVQD
ncbi:regulatory protein RecX [uncultured Megasphaera sp.]|uniref:regulatory protein RecX n=1 Tax=uncultured Megasphaera sp. TaxID=165188 RepID=UPI00265B4C2B|nr:regulatory protein RecX [uncultured Megasphaera sp.]